MNHKHTPGPWAAMQHLTDDKRDGALIVGPDQWNVASCWATRFQTGRSIEETDANAALIAAAPELLASLEAIMATVAGCQKEPIYEQARASIAKATGK